MVTHKHHIIPVHMGGSNEPTNLVELTVEEHAEAHRLLFIQYGRWQDEIAHRMLSGQISAKEATKFAQKYRDTSYMQTDEYRIKMSNSKKGVTSKRKGLQNPKLSLETKQKISESLVGNKRRLGVNHTEESIQKMRISSSKSWSIVSPTGETYTTNNLREFCENHLLSYRTFMTTKTYKKWKCSRIM